MNHAITPGSYGSPSQPVTLTIGQDGRVASMLPTLGGTAVEATLLQPVPTPVWGLIAAAVAIILWAARRPRETSAAARASSFRSEPSCEGSVERMVA